MSYTISLSGLEIDFKYSTGYSLLLAESSYYFIQIIVDQDATYNFSGNGIPAIDTSSITPGAQLFILTVFGDENNVVLMPTIFLKNVTAYKGLTLNAFVNDNTNRMKLSNITDANKNKNDNIFLYNVDSNNNIVSKIQNMGTSVYALLQPISKNLAVDVAVVPGNPDNMTQYIDPNVNTQVGALIINTKLYNGIINKTMPVYFTNTSSSQNGGSTNNGEKTQTNDKLKNFIIIIIIIIVAILILYVTYYLVKKHRKGT